MDLQDFLAGPEAPARAGSIPGVEIDWEHSMQYGQILYFNPWGWDWASVGQDNTGRE